MWHLWQGQFPFSVLDWLYIFPHEWQVFLLVVTRSILIIAVSGRCFRTVVFTESCSNLGWKEALQSVWSKSVSLAARVCVWRAGSTHLTALSGWHVASCLFNLLPKIFATIHFFFSVIFALLESYVKNIPKNKTFQTRHLIATDVKNKYICIWDLLGKCLPCVIENFAFVRLHTVVKS